MREKGWYLSTFSFAALSRPYLIHLKSTDLIGLKGQLKIDCQMKHLLVVSAEDKQTTFKITFRLSTNFRKKWLEKVDSVLAEEVDGVFIHR